MTEDKVVGWHQQCDGHDFEQALRDSEGQGSLAYCSLWCHKELDMTEWLKNSNSMEKRYVKYIYKTDSLWYVAKPKTTL